jgi:hypothetical protein
MFGFGKQNQPEAGTIDKTERFEVRRKISELVFNLGQVVKRDLGLGDIRSGEVQSPEFIAKATEIVNDDSLWDSLPADVQAGFTLYGAEHKVLSGTKDQYRQELKDLIERHG